MKKMICLILAAIMMSALLCGCSGPFFHSDCSDTFYCGGCGNKVTQKPHILCILDKELKICDHCAAVLEDPGAAD